MSKKSVVRLTEAECEILEGLIQNKKRRVSAQKVQRARILLKADADGACWSDREIAKAFDCRTQTIEKIRERFVTEGVEITKGAFYEVFKPAVSRSLVRQLEYCHTPKHGSWLNIAENELSSMTRQCVTGRRFATIEELREKTSAWHKHINARQRTVDWQFKVDDARTKLKSIYPNLED